MNDAPETPPEDHLRTEWSEDRTLMASERTFNSALATALGCIGVAIGMHAVFGGTEPIWLPKSVASLFLAIALFLIWAARIRAVHTRQRLHEHSAFSEGGTAITITAALVTIGILAIGAILWLL